MSDSNESADTESERTTIRSGREFEQEYRLDASEAGKFLINLGEQLRDEDELTISTEKWELPFAFGEPIELEIDFDGVGDPELEIELSLPGRTDEKAPDIE
ncbi:amphi-Trp domain-containing protein [Halogeometricum borinquense]|uniref:Amphi-Trp domain-containing protein n=1 Tax=Halogeometricum borinquense TaxID=60847 RepID=A0A6C0UHZ9_9EURY|nr:amphi-Trp domain-containing protein [Halogeometricum borinquense]QIB73911.1 amphi-Trp domain-containing protein [Halogeometricum borinquense]